MVPHLCNNALLLARSFGSVQLGDGIVKLQPNTHGKRITQMQGG